MRRRCVILERTRRKREGERERERERERQRQRKRREKKKKKKKKFLSTLGLFPLFSFEVKGNVAKRNPPLHPRVYKLIQLKEKWLSHGGRPFKGV